MSYDINKHYFDEAGQSEGIVNSTSKYKTSDSKTTVVASGYFVNPRLKIGDKILANTADGPVELYVSSLSPTTVTQFGNSTIQDNSIEQSKLVTQPAGYLAIMTSVQTNTIGDHDIFNISGLLTTDFVVLYAKGNINNEPESYQIPQDGELRVYYETPITDAFTMDVLVFREHT